jgi:hypothetical protein
VVHGSFGTSTLFLGILFCQNSRFPDRALHLRHQPATDPSRTGNYPHHLSETMSVTLPPLPYEYTALEPHISQRTLEIHHDKHHARYVATANTMIAGTDLENADLITIIKSTTNYPFLSVFLPMAL